jgi:hypothetical protein
MTKLPEGSALNHDGKCGNQRRALGRRDGMQPDGGRNQAECEAGNAVDQGADKSRQDEKEKIDRQFTQHRVPASVVSVENVRLAMGTM